MPPPDALTQLRDAVAHERALWERERTLLLQQLEAAQAREAASREREAHLLQLLALEQQQRLLLTGAAPLASGGWRRWFARWRHARGR